MIRVLVADDHPIVRSGVVGLLGTAADVEKVLKWAAKRAHHAHWPQPTSPPAYLIQSP